jgi:hypothetical protein
LLLPEASPKSSLSSWSDPPFADLPSSKNFINAGRHTHSNAQLKGRAMQFHAAHYGSPPHWVAWHKTQDSIRFYSTSFRTTVKLLKCWPWPSNCLLRPNLGFVVFFITNSMIKLVTYM